MPKELESLGKIGLVLSGGAGRVFFHVGALLTIGKLRTPFSYVAAVSAGALAAAKFLEVYPNVDELERAVHSSFQRPPFTRRKALKLLASRSFYDNTRLWELVKDFDIAKIAASPAEFHVVTTEISTERERIFSSKNDEPEAFRKSLIASTALPGWFEPVQIYNNFFIDGGMVNPLPLSNAILAGCDTIIAIDGSPREPRLSIDDYKKKTWVEILAKGYGISIDQLAKRELAEAKKVNREIIAYKWLRRIADLQEEREGDDASAKKRKKKVRGLFRRLSLGYRKKRIRFVLIRPETQLLSVSLRWNSQDMKRMIEEGRRVAEKELQKALLIEK